MKHIIEELELCARASRNCISKVEGDSQKEYLRGNAEAFEEAIEKIKKAMESRKIRLD